MLNEPKIEIKYLPFYEVDLYPTNSTIDNNLSNITTFTKDRVVTGKKGFYLSGGSYNEEKQEDIGTLMNGTYTFFDEVKKYGGIVGTELSNNNYQFDTTQQITLIAPNNSTIPYLVIYFDNIAGEYATKMTFSDEPNTIYSNNSYIFSKKIVGSHSSITITINQWSKQKSVFKILKITAGISNEYDIRSITDLYYTKDKFTDTDELRFGVSLQEATFQIIDRNGIINSLYNGGFQLKNIQVNIYIDGDLDSVFMVDNPTSDNNKLYWDFQCNDILKNKLQEKLNPYFFGVRTSILDFISYACSGSISYKYESDELVSELYQISPPIAFVETGQTREELLIKCCQVGLLRMYSDEDGSLLISRGI